MAKIIRHVDLSRIGEVIESCKRADIVGFDTETTGLNPRDGAKLRLVQLATPDFVYIFDAFKYPVELLRPIFDGSVSLAGHNLGFELTFLRANGIDIPYGKHLWDTMLSAQLKAAGVLPRPGFGLDDVVLRELGLEMDKTLQVSDWSGDLTEDQYKYAANDAWVMLPLVEKDRQEIAKAGLQKPMEIEMRCLPGMIWMSETGFPLNPEKWLAVAEKYTAEVDALEYALADLTNTKTLMDWSEVNWRSPAQVLAEFKRNGVHIDNTNDDVLSEVAAAGNELAQMLLTYRERVKRRDTYGKTWLEKYYDQTTGRVYAQWKQLGAMRTGRMSCANPNLQNIPHSHEYRDCFEAPEGYVFTMTDLSQIELRITVELTDDPVGIQAYVHDKSDLHVATAKLILGVDPNDPDKAKVKEARQVAKTLNFGLIYGAGAETMRLYAQSAFGVTMNLERAIRLRNAWRKTYTGIVAWHRSIKEGETATRTLSGRRRLAVTSFMEKLNTPVQGSGADGMKAALALMYERRHQLPANTAPVGVIHDEILFMTRPEHAEEVKAWTKKQMEIGMGSFMKKIPVVAEPNSGKTWADK